MTCDYKHAYMHIHIYAQTGNNESNISTSYVLYHTCTQAYIHTYIYIHIHIYAQTGN